MSRVDSFSNKQLKVLTWSEIPRINDNYDGIIADGSIRSGKTFSMSLSFVLWAMKNFNRCNFGMCGKTVGSFRRNVLIPLKGYLAGMNYNIQERRNDNLVTISGEGVTNYFYIFGGKDERSQDFIQGITLAGVFFDEVALMPESFVNQATGRCSISGSKYYFNCNPDSAMHWFKKNWIDNDNKRLYHVHFSLEDNPSLDDRTIERYKSMYSGVFKRRFIDGEWCVAEGLIYDCFNPEDALDEVDEPVDKDYYISCDYGTSNPCVFLLWQRGESGIWYLIDEYYYSGRDTYKQKTDQEYVIDFMKFSSGKVIKKVFVDPSAASFIAALRRAGYHVIPAKNDVIDGIRYTASLIEQKQLKVLTKCEHTIEEFGAYSWDDKKAEDTPIKESDHCMDAMRYFAYTHIRRTKARKGIEFA